MGSAVAAPVLSGPRYAFFDVDETLISIKSMFDFFPYWCATQGQAPLAQRFASTFEKARADGRSREDLNRLYYTFFAGAALDEVEAVGQQWFKQRFNHQAPPYIASAVARLRAHQAENVTPVFVSGSMAPLLKPLAAELGVPHWICTGLVVDAHRRLTGDIAPLQTIGAGKAEAIRSFLVQRGAHPQACFAYADDVSDLAMLEAVGTPVVVAGATALERLAEQRGWQVLPTHFTPTARELSAH